MFLRIKEIVGDYWIGKFCLLLLLLFGLTALVNVFLPEVAFDSLWYHLTLPKLYLSSGGIFHVPGGLLYYSEMPRLLEIIYIPLLKYANIYGVHLLNFIFGIGSAVLVYLVARRLADKTTGLLAMVVFYITPLVGWLSGAAYVDLGRTFFEVLSFYFLINRRYLLLGVALGLAASVKTLSLGSLFLFVALMVLQKTSIRKMSIVVATALIICIPWYLSAFLNTGYLFYPIGSSILDSTHSLHFNFSGFFFNYWRLFIASSDSTSPIYVAILPFLFLTLRSFKSNLDLSVLIYFLGSYLLWFLTPNTGGGRFIVPYLPIWAVLVGVVIFKLQGTFYRTILIGLVIVVAVINLGYRMFAVSKSALYLRQHSVNEYLCSNLAFETAVFYDCDYWFAKNIKEADTVLISGVHNLYYVNFPFIHETWYRGEQVNYVVVFGDNPSPYVQQLIEHGTFVYQNRPTFLRVWKL